MTIRYSINPDAIKDTPEELIGSATKNASDAPEIGATNGATNFDEGKLGKRAQNYLKKVPGAVSGSGGHNQTLAAACSLVEFGLTPEQAWPLLLEYNKRCHPEWSERELRHKLDDAFKKAKPDPEKVKSGVNYYPRDGKREIILPGQHISISDSAKNIFTVIAPTETLFNQNGLVVEVLRDKKGHPYFANVHAYEFRTRVEQHGRLVAWRVTKSGDSEIRPAKMSVDDAKSMLVSLEAKLLPPISMVVRCAILTEDPKGELVMLGNGYHDLLGGVMVDQAEPVEDVDLDTARKIMLSMVNEFQFVSEGDRSRSLAARITPALRMGGFLKGSIPIEVMEADEEQAGKGYSLQITTALYNDQPHFVAQREGGVGSVDESLAHALVSGHPFISFDNVRGRIASPYLESFLTCSGIFFARVPGQKEVPVDRERIMIMMTSNGMESTPDLAARSSICRIVKPKDKDGNPVKYSGMPQKIQDQQPFCLGAVHRLIKEWHSQGKPRLDGKGHDFHEWAGVLDFFVQELLGCAPLMDGHAEVRKRVSDPDMSWLRRVVLKMAENKSIGEVFSTKELVEFCEVHNLPVPGVRLESPSHVASRALGKRMEKLFAGENRIVIDHYVILREKVRGEDDHGESRSRWEYQVKES